jgi:hypothetical protein
MAVPHKCILTESTGRHKTAPTLFCIIVFFRVDFQLRAVKEMEMQETSIMDLHALQQ